jgi:hypothetical protein
MSTTYDIPITNPPQTFAVDLAGLTYNMAIRWNTIAQVWVLDISDSTGNLLIGGIPLVAGVDLLEQFGYLNFGGQLWAISTDTPLMPIPFTDFGTPYGDGHLYFITPT